MSIYSDVPMKHSISAKLLTVVFAIYLGVAVVVMLTHMGAEYVETRRRVNQELGVLQKAFERGVATSLWYLDIPLLESEMRGMLEHYVVVGVTIVNDTGEGFIIGETHDRPGKNTEVVTTFRMSTEQKSGELSSLIEHNFPLVHNSEDGERYEVGTASIYSSHAVILRRLQWKLLLILLATIINMTAFWVIVLLVGQRLLSRPLAILTEGAGQLNLDNLEHVRVDIGTQGRDELKILEEAFNSMIQKLLKDRTELYALSNALQQNQQQLQDILDNATAVIFLKDIDGRYLLINRQFESLFHISKHEIIGRTDYDIFPKEMADTFGDNDHRVLDANAPLEMEEYAPQDDGIHTYMSIKFPLHAANGRIYAVCGIATDISERKDAEERIRKLNQELELRVQKRTARLSDTNALLKESEQRLKEAQRIARLGNWEWNVHTNELFWSDEIHRIFGVQPQEFGSTYEAFLATIHPDDRETVMQAVHAALYDDKLYNLDHRIVQPDGTVCVAHEQGEVTFDEQHEPIRMLGTVQDITERKRMEETLQESEEKYRFLIENTGIQFSYYTVDGKILSYNKAAADFVGSTPEALQGQFIQELFPEEMVASHHERVQRTIESEAPVEFEDFIHMPDKDIWLYTSAKKICDAEGEIKGILVIASDMTARKMAEEQLHKAKQDAEAANRAKSVFLANMSHELRTPLHSIIGFARQLELDAALTDAQHHDVGIIHRNGEHLLTLLNSVLDFTKIEADMLELQPSQFDLRGVLDPLAEMSRLTAEQKGLTFVCDAPVDLPHIVYGDRKRLRQILRNLLGNAIRFTEQGTVTLKILECRVQSADSKNRKSQITNLKFEISDTGIGIAAGHLETLFEPFQQADPHQLQEGSQGLGLAISQRFVQMMGSQLQVASTQGEGSTFWFAVELPVIDAPVMGGPSQVQTHVPEHPSQKILTTALAALPADWLATLKHAAEYVDIQGLSDITHRINERDPMLAGTLVHLTEEFEYDEILRLIQESG